MLYYEMKSIPFKIKESLEELKLLRQRSPDHRIKLRVQSLMLTKENKIQTRHAIAQHMGIDKATLRRWKKTYIESGLEGLLTIRKGGKRRCYIDPSLHLALDKKLHDAEDPFMSYTEAIRWVNMNHNQTIKYQALRKYLIVHFKSKLKQPRKSHYKKDDEAIEAFKKTAQ